MFNKNKFVFCIIFSIMFCASSSLLLAQADTEESGKKKPIQKKEVLDFSDVVEGSQYLVSVNERGAAFQGNDVVAAHQLRVLVAGEQNLSVWHGGATYFFSSQHNLNLFLRDPYKYVPSFGGYCGMSMSKGIVDTADVKTMMITDGRLVVHRNRRAVGMWSQAPGINSYEADRNWLVVLGKRGKAVEFQHNLDQSSVAFGGV